MCSTGCYSRGPALGTGARAGYKAQTDVIPMRKMEIEGEEDNGICVICLDVMDVPAAIVTLDCGHKFHGACIVKNMYTSTRCPVCRNDPDEDDQPHGRDLAGPVDVVPSLVPSLVASLNRCGQETLIAMCEDFGISASGNMERLAEGLAEQLLYETDSDTED